MGTFPFGVPVQHCSPIASGQRAVLVLGAYPSALHVRWEPPEGSAARVVRALAVDNEPEPFWTGEDDPARIRRWAADRAWSTEWGSVMPAPGINGPSGQWVQDHVLARFGIERAEAWITDCLDTYKASERMRVAVEAVYNPFAQTHGLPTAELERHPSEAKIVAEARRGHLRRIRNELDEAQPEVVVTLGNAALRVFRALLNLPGVPVRLVADAGYGAPLAVAIGGRSIRWFPLAHPAAPSAYQKIHRGWTPGGAGRPRNPASTPT